MSEDAEVTISYLILCHDSPDRIVRLVTRILSDDETGQVVIHYDKNSSRTKFNDLKNKLNKFSRCHVLINRVRCGWGKWGLVEATLRGVGYSYENICSDYYYLLSEYCYPAQPLVKLKSFLSESQPYSFIERCDHNWVKAGISKDRYRYRFYFNKRKHPRLHKFFYRVQKNIGLQKKVPNCFNIKYGSQWWCIHKSSVMNILEQPTSIKNFFRYSWIPDEMFFASCFSDNNPYINKSLTYYNFDELGQPVEMAKDESVQGVYYFKRKVK